MAEVIDEIVVRISGDASAFADTINEVSSALSNFERQQSGGNGSRLAQSTSKDWENTGKSIKEVGSAVDNAMKPVQYAATATAALGTASAMMAVKFEDNFANVKKTVDGTPEQLAKIRQEIIDMSTVGINGHNAIPQTTAELTELAAAGGQLGIATENISSFTETMAMLGSATNLYGEQGAQTLARFMNVTNTSQNEIANLGSAIVDLGNNFATTEAEIADMALNMGATGSVVGISAQDVLAYSTALSSLGVDAAAGGSAVSRIWMDIQSAVSSGGETLQKFAKLSGMSAQEFKQQWQTDASGAFQKFLKGLSEDKDQVSTLSKLGFNNIRDIQALQRLAGEKGFDLLTDAIARSNTAWSENTALQTEFDAKSETTASQLKIAKNNAIEAARSFGEIMLPSIVSVTGGLSGMMQGLASTSDGTKKLVVGAGAAVVGLGALSKGAASTIKTVGGVAEGVGKLKKAAQGTDAVAKLASGFLSVGSAAGPVAIGLAAVGVAAFAGKKAYDAWYTSQYRWSEGLSEGNAKIKESIDRYKALSSIQNEIKSLRLTIDNPDSSSEQVQAAKSRLEEIKELLSKEYNLVINSDNSNLDSVVDSVTSLSKTQLQLNISSQNAKLVGLRDKFDSFNQSEYDNVIREQAKLGELMVKAQEIDKKYSGASADSEVLKKRAEALNELGKAYGYSSEEIAAGALNVSDLSIRYEQLGNRLQKLTDQKNSHDEYVAISTELANWNTELLRMSAVASDAEGVSQALSNIGMYVKNAGLDMNGYAQAAAQAMNGIDLETAWTKGGDALNSYVNDYVRAMRGFGASAEETYTGAALIRQGFHSIAEAAENGELENVAKQATELAQAAGDIPNDKHIVINANGDISIIEDVQAAVDKINENGDVKLSVSANGDVSALETADEKLQELIDNNQVTITFNAQTNGFDISDLTGKSLGQITADGKINWTNGEQETPEDKPAKVNYELGDQADPKNKTAYVNYVERGGKPKENARGTQSFSGGLALVNDDGRADPRELIVDGGRAFIPEGRDVVLPLSRGARVYTSEQTKAIMSGLGIPHYASGKNNSDAFTAARDDRSHYTKTHSVTTEQELRKWLEFQEKYKENEKDIADIEEQVFSLRQKLYNERVQASEKWLRHEEKYNGMSVSDYLAGIDRMKAYTAEYYAQGIINHKEYTEAIADLDEKYLDKAAEGKAAEYSAWKKDADAWQEMRSTYGDWDKYGDSEEAFLKRKIQRVKEMYEAGTIGFEEFIDDTNRYSMDLYKAQEGYVDDMLQKQRDYISDMREQFQKEEQALQDSWTVADRKADMSEVSAQLDIYAGSVTDRGQQKYKELQEQMKRLRRDEELYQLQARNNAAIEGLEADYKTLEENKKNILNDLRATDIDISGYVESLKENISKSSSKVEGLLSTLINKLDSFRIESNSMSDNRKITYNLSQLTPEQILEFCNFSVGN